MADFPPPPPVDLTRLVRGHRVAGEVPRPLDFPRYTTTATSESGSWLSAGILIPLVIAFVAGFAAFYLMKPKADAQLSEEERIKKRSQALMFAVGAAAVGGIGGWWVYRNYMKGPTPPPAQILQ